MFENMKVATRVSPGFGVGRAASPQTKRTCIVIIESSNDSSHQDVGIVVADTAAMLAPTNDASGAAS